MKSPRHRTALLPVLLALLTCVAPAAAIQDESPADEPEQADAAEPVVTEHTLSLAGDELEYRATAGTITIKEDGDAPKADIFYVYYEAKEDDARRPLTFCFNGGPGSSSVWLHMGAFGPRRVPMPTGARTPKPPYRLIDNEGTLLDLSDLVFVDPVTTGYSRAIEGEDDGQFHGVREDVQWMAEFIRLFVTRYERWDSPKFLAGESYGTTRAAGLAAALQDRHGMYLNGVILISSILSFQTARFDTGNDLPYVLFLPTYTATAWYHRRLAPELQADLRTTLEEAEAFALGDYATALLQGDRLPPEDRSDIATRLARLTGLSIDYVERTNLRIDIHRFTKELRRDERTTVGRLDSRFTGRDADATGTTSEYDPSYSAIQGPYTAVLNDYVRGELGYENDTPYEILTGRVHPWKWRNGQGYVDMSDSLRVAMSKNPHLMVFVANGTYDLATPYFATEYTFAHLGLEPELRDNVVMGYYEAGHMMYVEDEHLLGLKRDLAAFYAKALAD